MRLWRYGQAIERLGQRYRLMDMLGGGGMADVCLAWDEHEKRFVAIKLMKPDQGDQRLLDSFLKEAARVAKWRHPNILCIYDGVKLELLDAALGTIVPYIVMEFAEGGDLQNRLVTGEPYPLADTLSVFAQICRAVSFAHEQGVIHRDLKPLNILFRRCPDGSEQAILSDFGLSVEADATHLTFARGGTLSYMAPEQLLGQVVEASDIFGLGVILYQLCTGHLPFRRSLQDLSGKVPHILPPHPSVFNAALPPSLDEVIFTALAEQPEARFADAMLFWQYVRATIDGDPLLASLLDDLERQEKQGMHSYTGAIWETPDDGSDYLTQGRDGQENLPGRERTDVAVLVRDTQKIQQQRAAKYVSRDLRTGQHKRVDLGQMTTVKPAVGPLSLFSRTVPARLPSLSRRPTRAPSSAPRTKELFAMVTIIVLILLAGTSIFAVRYPEFLGALFQPAGPAIVKIIPQQRVMEDTYPFLAVEGQPDLTRRQVAARLLTTSSSPMTRTVSGTIDVQEPGTVAKGILTLYNGAGVPQTVPTGTILTGKSGVQVIIDHAAQIPAADPQNTRTFGMLDVPAHAVNVGTQGNIAARDIDQVCPCSANQTIYIRNNAAFTGGQDPQSGMFVQQSDIDRVVSLLKDEQQKQTQEDMQHDLAPNEQLMDTPQCNLQARANPPLGPGVYITMTRLTITTICQGEAYDYAALQRMTEQLLKDKANADPVFKGYMLADKIAIQSTRDGDQPHQPGLFSLLVKARGTWCYAISDAQKQAMLMSIVGQQVNAASATLKRYPGVADVKLNIRGSKLPGNPASIRIVIEGA